MTRLLVCIVVFPALLGVSCVGAWAAMEAGVPEPAVVVAVTLSATLVLTVLQRVAPYSTSWWVGRKEWLLDLCHGLVSNGAAVELGRAAWLGGLVALANALSTKVGGTLWPDVAPLALQVALALLIAELGGYWWHRLSHTIPVLWRLHALHHSSERMHVLASVRTHPLHSVVTYFALTTPLILLGAPSVVIAMCAVFTSVHGMLQHANVDVRVGPLSWVFSTPDLHRWHHSRDVAESHHNFGNNLIVWDVLFGTRFLPSDRQAVEVGLADIAIRPNYFQHLWAPFVLERLMVRDPSTENA